MYNLIMQGFVADEGSHRRPKETKSLQGQKTGYVKMSASCKVIYRSVATPIKIPPSFLLLKFTSCFFNLYGKTKEPE